MRLAAALVVLALGAGSLSGQERGNPPKLDPPPKQAGGMVFTWVKEGPADKCGSDCKEWVSAKGTIVPDTARDFEAFARTRDIAGKVVVLELPRRRRQCRPDPRPRLAAPQHDGQPSGRPSCCPPTHPASSARAIHQSAMCASMCPFVLLGGARRHVPPEARILVHQIWPGAARADSTAAIYSAQHVAAVLRATSEIARYTVDMGGEIELFDLSMRIPPWEDLRVLTQPRCSAPGSTPSTRRSHDGRRCGVVAAARRAAADRRTVRVASQRWTLVGEGADRGVVRRHPLTIEGEEIGSLLITFACSDQPTNIKLRYWETRRVGQRGRRRDARRHGARPRAHPADDRILDAWSAGGLNSIANAMVPQALVAKLLAANQSARHRGDADEVEGADRDPDRDSPGLGQVLPQLSSRNARASQRRLTKLSFSVGAAFPANDINARHRIQRRWMGPCNVLAFC